MGWLTPAKQGFSRQYAEAKDTKNAIRLEELDLFRRDVNSFIRAYDFLAQIVDYHDTSLEKRSIFYRLLAPPGLSKRKRPQDRDTVQLLTPTQNRANSAGRVLGLVATLHQNSECGHHGTTWT